jgi:hypothetical protein
VFMYPLPQKVSGAVSLGGKWCDHKADNPHLSSVKIKRTWSYTSTTPCVFMVLCLIKHSNNFINQ